MTRIILPGVIACALIVPAFAAPRSNSYRSSSTSAARSTMARPMNANFNRNFSAARNLSAIHNSNALRQSNALRNVNAFRNSNAVRNANASHNLNAFRNRSDFRGNAARNAANQNHHHHRTRVVFVNYGGWGWGGWDWGWPYWDYYPYYYGYGYGYGPSVSFNFTGDDYSYDPYMNYGSAPNSYNGYYSTNPQPPDSRDGEYNVGNASVVAKVQQALKRDGYYKGDVDGALGSRTTYAIRAYQRDHGLQASGTVDEELLRTMGLR